MVFANFYTNENIELKIMRAVIQRVKESYVKVDGDIISQISNGFNILVGFCKEDYPSIVKVFGKFVDKILSLRVFEDENGKMNLNLVDIDGEILLVSQFTLYADLSRGRRPSFDRTLEFEKAYELFLKLQEEFLKRWSKVKIGAFGKSMEVQIINMGPATFIFDWEVKDL